MVPLYIKWQMYKKIWTYCVPIVLQNTFAAMYVQNKCIVPNDSFKCKYTVDEAT